jgi:3-phytase
MPLRPVQKELVLDLEDIVGELNPEFPTLDNFEGMCFGPRLPNGNRTLILVSDNNFRARQRTAFLVFEIVETKGPV